MNINSVRPLLAHVALLVWVLSLVGCVKSQSVTTKPEPTPSQTPETRTIHVVDIVERADQMCKKENDCRQAVILYTQAINDRGESTELLKKRGMAYYSLKAIELAIADFSKAIDLQKDSKKKDAELFFIRGLSRSLSQNEESAGACSDFKIASKLGWKSPDKEFDQWYAGYCLPTK